MEHIFEDSTETIVSSRKSSLNLKSNGAQEHRKSKSLSLGDLNVHTKCFEAVAIQDTSGSSSFIFLPISTVLRAHLPLAWLSGCIDSPITPGALLRADIWNVTRWEYHILIAKLSSSGALFAFEKVDNNSYVCYPLHHWVKQHWIEQAVYGAAPVANLDSLLNYQKCNLHSRRPSSTNNAAAAAGEISGVLPSPKIHKPNKGHLARLSILEPRDRLEDSMSENKRHPLDSEVQFKVGELNNDPTVNLQDNLQLLHGETQPDLVTELRPLAVPVDDNEMRVAHASPDEEMPKAIDHLSADHLRRQYLETLYLSKTSLAFYAKGPLSRARARTRIPGASRSAASLAEFYTECILSAKRMDTKYKESITQKIKNNTRHDEVPQNKENPPARKTRRTRLGKDGLWPIEDEYVEKWWRNQDLSCSSTQTIEALTTEMKHIVFQLRMRETEMQILLILEVLALQLKDIPNQQEAKQLATSDIKFESVEIEGQETLAKVPTKKKNRDLTSELDLLIDRLCIWHSVGMEDVASIHGRSKSDSSPEKLKDRLRDFCKDVVVPFYAAKLSDQCQAICTKMGGAEVTPRRSKGTSGKGPVLQQFNVISKHDRPSNKRNLQRVLSEDQNMRHASPPTLSRSATLPTPAGVKREPSERPISRSGLQKSVSFSNREVDLVADARVTAAKRRKLDMVAAQKRELDAAIETLKRPNRTSVAKNFMDEAERRTTDGKTATKKIEPVQISATPRRGRVHDPQAEDYDLPPMPLAIGSSEGPVVPSSTIKPRGLSQVGHVLHSSVKKREVLSAIHDTPSKSNSRQNKPLLVEHQVHERNQLRRGISNSSLITSTPSVSRLRLDLGDSLAATPLQMTKSLKPVMLTPMERSEISIEQAFRDAPEIPERAGKVMDRVMGSKADLGEVSLYESLGWDDDYDL